MVEWSDSYLIGNDRIDFEHRIFFDLISKFSKAREDGSDPARLERIFDEIVLYAKFHFRSEENLMIDIGYPGLDEHKTHHFKLTNDLSAKIVGMKMKTMAPATVEAFLVDWFVHHVTLDDVKIGAFISAHTPPTPA